MNSLEAELKRDLKAAGALSKAHARLQRATQELMLAMQNLASLADAHAPTTDRGAGNSLECMARELQEVQLCALQNVRHLSRAAGAIQLAEEAAVLKRLAKQSGFTGAFRDSYAQYHGLRRDGLELFAKGTGLFLQNLGARMASAGASVLGCSAPQEQASLPKAKESPQRPHFEVVVEPSKSLQAVSEKPEVVPAEDSSRPPTGAARSEPLQTALPTALRPLDNSAASEFQLSSLDGV